MGDMQAIRTLMNAPELHSGLLAGIATAAVVALVVLALRSTTAERPTRPGVVGPALVVATLAALGGFGPFDEVWPVPQRVVLALAALFLAGLVATRAPWPVTAFVALGGGAGLVDPDANFPIWVVAILVLGPALAGAAAADLDRRAARHGLGPQLLLVSIVGLYSTVPDTELVLVLLGAAIPITLLTVPPVRARLGAGGAYASIGLFLWIATLEGAGRPGSTVGAVAALGLLLTEPLGRLLAPRIAVGRQPRPSSPGRVNRGGLVVAQVLLVAYAARVAGFVDDPVLALVLALPAVAVGVALGTRFAIPTPELRYRRSSRRRRRSHSEPPPRPARPARPSGALDRDGASPRSDPSLN